jgi:hypothetical protein
MKVLICPVHQRIDCFDLDVEETFDRRLICGFVAVFATLTPPCCFRASVAFGDDQR